MHISVFWLEFMSYPTSAAIHQWFNTSLFKPARPQPGGPPVLEDDSYKVESILQIKQFTHAKVKWIGHDSS